MHIALASRQPLSELKRASTEEIATWIEILDQHHGRG